MYDVLIIGGGPAGLTAAVYALRAGKTALVIEKSGFGGRIAFSPKVENFPGCVETGGMELAEHFAEHAIALGADTEFAEVTAVEKTEDGFCVHCEDGGCYHGKTVIVATGARSRTLGLPNEEALVGAGVSYCAVCDGSFFKGERVAIVGGGNSALQEAVLLSDLCREVTLLQNLPACTGEQALVELLQKKPNVRFRYNTTVAALLGDTELTGVRILNSETGREETLELEGLFIAIGLLPATDAFSALLPLTDAGYFDADEDCKTPIPGVFVAGDCRRKGVRQLTTAVADGSVAALAACACIDAQK